MEQTNKFIEKFDGEHVMIVVGHTIIINNIPTPRPTNFLAMNVYLYLLTNLVEMLLMQS
jgi:hypothetical protein